jgi:hypothetical protein
VPSGKLRREVVTLNSDVHLGDLESDETKEYGQVQAAGVEIADNRISVRGPPSASRAATASGSGPASLWRPGRFPVGLALFEWFVP